ncbi:hypothetical protein [Flavicella sp.]
MKKSLLIIMTLASINYLTAQINTDSLPGNLSFPSSKAELYQINIQMID